MRKIQVEISKWELVNGCGSLRWATHFELCKAGKNNFSEKDDLRLCRKFCAKKCAKSESCLWNHVMRQTCKSSFVGRSRVGMQWC